MAKRIMVIANKHWEADPLVNALISDRVVPLELLGSVEVVNHPFFLGNRDAPNKRRARPRVEIELAPFEAEDRTVKGRLEVWCIQDLMNPNVSSSSTLEKAKVLPLAFAYTKRRPDFVIAFGTAAGPPGIPMNGSVVIGSSAFIHDPFADSENPGFWKPPRADELIVCEPLPRKVFDVIGDSVRCRAERRFLRPPLQPSEPGIIVAGDSHIGLSNVNITSYDDYAWADPELLERFLAVDNGRSRVGSVETTHGVIREEAGDDTPFLFTSGIANAVGRFDYEVAPRVYAQDFVAAHNAGATVAWFIPELLRLLS